MELRSEQGEERDRETDEERVPETAFLPASPVADGKVLRGKDGWLFLAGDSNDVLGQHTGEVRLDADQLARWRTVLEGRRETVAGMGAHYLFAIPPDTHAVYPDKLPDHVQPVAQRPVTQLCDHLARHKSPVKPIYLLDELRHARQQRLVCFPSDTHWNEYGAFVAYDRIADEIERLMPIRRLQAEDLIFIGMAMVGDLSYKLEADEHDVTTVSFVRNASAVLVEDNRVEGSGAVLTTECRDATGSCVLVGDSYAWGLVKLLAEGFRHFTFVHMATFDSDFVASRKPDVVVNMLAERYLVHVPDDEQGQSVQARAEWKRSIGRSRPQAPYWEITTPLSVDTVERMRAALLAEGRLRDATILSVLAYAGLQPEELVALRWRDIDGDHIDVLRPTTPGRAERVRVIGPLLRRRRLRGAHVRTVPLMEHLAADLERWRASFDGRVKTGGFVFPGADRGYWRRGEWRAWREQVYAPLARASGLVNLTPNACRHAMAMLLINAGASPKEVARAIGTAVDLITAEYGTFFFYADAGVPIPVPDQIRRVRARVAASGEPRPE
jgi:alginate O-acetyltransferase complex protein AlgJ